MKEILFRGKHKNEWIYGWYLEKQGEHRIYTKNEFDPYVSKIVDKDTVTQYIGIKDCNHVPIFEGDIMAMWEDEEWNIKGFINYTPSWCAYDLCVFNEGKVYHSQWNYEIDKEDWNKLTVIGNIFENKELLPLLQWEV